MDYAANRRRDFSRDGPLPNHVTNTPAEPHLAHGESPLIVRAIQKDSVVLKYSSRGTTYGPYRRQFRVRERLPCRITRRDTARIALSAVCLCVPRNAGHVTEQPRRGIFFAKNAVAGANYSCVRARHTTPHHCLANGRHGEAIGTIRRGKSAIHFIAGPELGGSETLSGHWNARGPARFRTIQVFPKDRLTRDPAGS
jgi:hypothetical protein